MSEQAGISENSTIIGLSTTTEAMTMPESNGKTQEKKKCLRNLLLKNLHMWVASACFQAELWSEATGNDNLSNAEKKDLEEKLKKLSAYCYCMIYFWLELVFNSLNVDKNSSVTNETNQGEKNKKTRFFISDDQLVNHLKAADIEKYAKQVPQIELPFLYSKRDSFTRDSDSRNWFKYWWQFLHSLSIMVDGEPDLMMNYLMLFENLWPLIPCQLCSDHWKDNKSEEHEHIRAFKRDLRMKIKSSQKINKHPTIEGTEEKEKTGTSVPSLSLLIWKIHNMINSKRENSLSQWIGDNFLEYTKNNFYREYCDFCLPDET